MYAKLYTFLPKPAQIAKRIKICEILPPLYDCKNKKKDFRTNFKEFTQNVLEKILENINYFDFNIPSLAILILEQINCIFELFKVSQLKNQKMKLFLRKLKLLKICFEPFMSELLEAKSRPNIDKTIKLSNSPEKVVKYFLDSFNKGRKIDFAFDLKELG
ncbi:hypothetical protein TRFO_32868 [Tritrichomonas foetus]|uniref:Uncharacterized protein n=1 Tax=Tritrichomonas foetus TaxID=1144522 RepID=A0A1J4JSF4_9EUKA|nr:hypothetical protein TRFO_32868 [Tritrichomonas foetus]|eukprot:OHT00460.1 hypothetical protein TRFO_32868 [Tritrichomonas foetus]